MTTFPLFLKLDSMAEEDQATSSGLREAPPPGEQTLEAQKAELYYTIDQKDKELEGHLVFRIPSKSGADVLIFTRSDSDVNSPILNAGVSLDNGPFLVPRNTDLAKRLDDIISDRERGQDASLTRANWEDIVPSAEQESGRRQIIADLRAHKEEWKSIYSSSKTMAEIKIREQAAQRQVVPDLLDYVKNAGATESPFPTATPGGAGPTTRPPEGSQESAT